MKRFKNLSLKKKRTLAIAGVSVLCLVVVGTIAFNQDSIFFNNLFKLADDNVEFVETFDSPDDWQPCQEIDKTAVARNKNTTPRYVRMKINEYWRTKNSQTPASDHETSDLPLTWDDSGTTKNYAIINTQNDDKWELKRDGWYYYKTTLAQNESTLSLLKSVTFNCEVNTAGEIRYSADGKAGESVPTEYSEATYHLYITFQMSDEEMKPEQHTADCDSNSLYDHIACITNGTDENVDFSLLASKSLNNGNGVNTLSAHKDDYYPVYYYRGEVDNHVIFADTCWRIVRTTATGGIKVIYNGSPINGSCRDVSDTETSSVYASIGRSDYQTGHLDSRFHIEYFDFRVSNARSVITSWYGSNMMANGAYIEDTNYCNDLSYRNDMTVPEWDTRIFGAYDRLIVNHSPSIDCVNPENELSTSNGLIFPAGLITADEAALGGLVTDYYDSGEYYKNYLYAGKGRYDDIAGDSFWTMTPLSYARQTTYSCDMFVWNSYLYDAKTMNPSSDFGEIRPVISLKPGVTYVAGGTGAQDNPYVIEQN